MHPRNIHIPHFSPLPKKKKAHITPPLHRSLSVPAYHVSLHTRRHCQHHWRPANDRCHKSHVCALPTGIRQPRAQWAPPPAGPDSAAAVPRTPQTPVSPPPGRWRRDCRHTSPQRRHKNTDRLCHSGDVTNPSAEGEGGGHRFDTGQSRGTAPTQTADNGTGKEEV